MPLVAAIDMNPVKLPLGPKLLKCTPLCIIMLLKNQGALLGQTILDAKPDAAEFVSTLKGIFKMSMTNSNLLLLL